MAKKPYVLHVAAEVAPLAKVGGLADVVGSLPQALSTIGIKSDAIIPWYGGIKKPKNFQNLGSFPVLLGNEVERAQLIYTRLGKQTIYGIKHPLFAQREIYRNQIKPGQPSDVERFTFFCQAVVAAIESDLLQPDLIHCHDWHSGLVPTFLDYAAIHRNLRFIPTVFTIHNLAHQGQHQITVDEKTVLHPDAELAVLEDSLDDDMINVMKIAILTADKITTVSPSYAREILQPEQSMGLEFALKRRQRDIVGILNGIDELIFNPQKDRYLTTHYSQRTWNRGKKNNRKYLLKQSNLPEINALVIGMVTRLVEQKGLDLVLRAWPQLQKNNIQLVILGLGDPVYEKAFKKLALQYPQRISLHSTFDLRLAQHIYAGSDAFLMPSRFEPCGLGQMISMRYGTVPIVRATGGLKDTVIDGVNGYAFRSYTHEALTKAILRALALSKQGPAWYTMVRHGMSADFSWKKSAQQYNQLYQSLL